MSINFQLNAPQIAQDIQDLVHERCVILLLRCWNEAHFDGEEESLRIQASQESVFLARWCGLLVHMRDHAGLRLDIRSALLMLGWDRLTNLCGTDDQPGWIGDVEVAKMLRPHLTDEMMYWFLIMRIGRALCSYRDIPDYGFKLRR